MLKILILASLLKELINNKNNGATIKVPKCSKNSILFLANQF
jgi:hypothetical protein